MSDEASVRAFKKSAEEHGFHPESLEYRYMSVGWDEATRQAEAREVRLADVLVATVESLEMPGGGNPAGNPALYAICQSIKSAALRERELAAMEMK